MIEKKNFFFLMYVMIFVTYMALKFSYTLKNFLKFSYTLKNFLKSSYTLKNFLKSSCSLKNFFTSINLSQKQMSRRESRSTPDGLSLDVEQDAAFQMDHQQQATIIGDNEGRLIYIQLLVDKKRSDEKKICTPIG